MELRFSVPSTVQYGRGCVGALGELLCSYHVKKALLVHGKSVFRSGLTEPVRKSMEDAGIGVVVFDKVMPDPTDTSIEEGAALAKAEGVEAIVAIGGGSAMDCAKGINILQNNPGPIAKYEGGDQVENRGLLLVCIPTTAGTSSEISNVSIVTDTARERKYIIAGRNVGADYALVDPSLTDNLPKSVTAATGMDALTHAIESYVSIIASPITKPLSMQAAKIIYQNLADAVNTPNAKDARDEMSLACIIVGCAFSNAALGLVHAIAHALGAHFGIAHGTACALTLPYVIEFNSPVVKDAYEELAQAMCPGTKQSLADMVKDLEKTVGVPTLAECGVPEDQLAFLASETMKEDYMTNPNHDINEEVVLEILKKAYHAE